MNVLVAIDEPDTGADLLQRAFDHFGDTADYAVLTIGQLGTTAYPAAPTGMSPAMLWLPVDSGRDKREASAEEAVEMADVPDGDIEVLTRTGPAGPVICEVAAKRSTDIIVIGASERGWLSRMVTPSVGHHVVDNAPCDVLVAHAAADE